jgi:Transposase IS116/IS110/IS902 family
MGIPGVGPLVAITFKSAIDNPGRIVKSKTVGALFGLVRHVPANVLINVTEVRSE